MDPLSSLTDLELFRKVASSDPKALEILYDRYSPLLYSLIKKIVVNEAAAEELLADTFTIVWKKIDYFDLSGGNAYAWLVMLARNKAIDYARRSRSENPVTEPYDDIYENNYIVPHFSPGETMELEKAFESRDTIEAALSRLTDAQKYVIHLAFYEGFSEKEIAGKLNIPIQTIKGKLQIAINNLRDNLKKQAVS